MEINRVFEQENFILVHHRIHIKLHFTCHCTPHAPSRSKTIFSFRYVYICLYHPTWLLSKLFTAPLVCLVWNFPFLTPSLTARFPPNHPHSSATASVSHALQFSTTMRCYYEIDWEIYLDIYEIAFIVNTKESEAPMPSSASVSSLRLLFFLLLLELSKLYLLSLSHHNSTIHRSPPTHCNPLLPPLATESCCSSCSMFFSSFHKVKHTRIRSSHREGALWCEFC